MPVAICAGQSLNRRQWLLRSAATIAVAGPGSLARPNLSRAADRPLFAGGIQSGDVSANSAVIWGAPTGRRGCRSNVCLRELRDHHWLGSPRRATGPRLRLGSSARRPAGGAGHFLRVRFDDISENGIEGETQIGQLRTAPTARSDICSSGRAILQGRAGIDPSRGGCDLPHHARQPAGLFHPFRRSIYADCPVEPELKLPDGEVWRNIVTEQKSVARAASTVPRQLQIQSARRQFRAFNAEVPMFAQWDNHEVINHWAPLGTHDKTGFVEDGSSRLVARARRALHEFMPMRAVLRSGRVIAGSATARCSTSSWSTCAATRETPGTSATTGATPLSWAPRNAWLKRELVASDATWKVIAADMPIGLFSDRLALATARRSGGSESRDCCRSWSAPHPQHGAAYRRHAGTPPRTLRSEPGDLADFEPIWDFVSGPLHAGRWRRGRSITFGPKAMYQKGCSAEQASPRPPSACSFSAESLSTARPKS